MLFGETHGGQESHAVLQALLREPRLGAVVDDIVVEFGNPLHQETMDRYVAGEDVPFAELSRAWRDTAIPLTWDSPLYAAFFATVREVNRGRPEAERLRVVLGEGPIDWDEVLEPAAYKVFADRSGDFYRTVEREVLAKGHRALLVIGGMHVLRRDVRNGFAPELPRFPGVGQLLDRNYPGRSFALWPVQGEHELGARVAAWPVPALAPLAGTPLGAETFGAVAPRNVQIQREVAGELVWVPLESHDWPRMDEMVDALLYLGPVSTSVPAPVETYHDREYVEELRRRCGILDDFYGFDSFRPALDALLAQDAGAQH